MSNKTQLQTNNTALDALITRVNAAKDTAASLPEAGGGGGSVDTCTVVINHPYTRSYDYINSHCATTYANGTYLCDYSQNASVETSSFTINNVVCGTCLYISSHMYSTMWGYSFDKSELLDTDGEQTAFSRFFIIKITANAGEISTINIYDND